MTLPESITPPAGFVVRVGDARLRFILLGSYRVAQRSAASSFCLRCKPQR